MQRGRRTGSDHCEVDSQTSKGGAIRLEDARVAFYVRLLISRLELVAF